MPFWHDARAFFSDLGRRERLNDQRPRPMIRGTQLPDEHLLPPLPALPAERPRPLTPSPSHENLYQPAADATADSAFFQMLPPEIRRQILLEAFGKRCVHMDLRFDHPELPLPPGEAARENYSHCRHNVDWERRYRQPPPAWNLDYSMPKRWIWQSSVCHQRRPPHGDVGPMVHDPYANPAEDRCRYGDLKDDLFPKEDLCQDWPGEKPSKCFIGVMGWLLSCRAA